MERKQEEGDLIEMLNGEKIHVSKIMPGTVCVFYKDLQKLLPIEYSNPEAPGIGDTRVIEEIKEREGRFVVIFGPKEKRYSIGREDLSEYCRIKKI